MPDSDGELLRTGWKKNPGKPAARETVPAANATTAERCYAPPLVLSFRSNYVSLGMCGPAERDHTFMVDGFRASWQTCEPCVNGIGVVVTVARIPIDVPGHRT